MKTLTMKEWMDKGTALFGSDKKNWKFKCCRCGESQSYYDFANLEIEEPENKMYFSCIGRWAKDRGCNWTLGGLFQIHEQEVIAENGKAIPTFVFDEEPKP